MTEKEALRLALEALEANLANWNAKRKAIPIIKEVLEQPVSYRAVKTYHGGKPVYVQETEPFAWYVDFGNEDEPNYFSKTKPDEPKALVRPLYTFPPKRKWQGLTDEEIEEVERWVEFKEEGSGRIPTGKLVRYIEAKLKEKNT